MPISPSFNPFENKGKHVKLPQTLHEMLDLALTDMKSILKNPHFEIDFSNWIENSDEDDKQVCKVCLGGSVLVGTLKLDERFDTDFIKEFHKIRALDDLRKGYLNNAYYDFYNEELDKDNLNKMFGKSIYWEKDFRKQVGMESVSYFNNSPLEERQTAFFTYMEKLHTFLKSEGI